MLRGRYDIGKVVLEDVSGQGGFMVSSVGSTAEGGWFVGHISRKVGDESNSFFWTDPWVVGTPLCERFGRLFDLTENKSALVAEMFVLGWGAGGAAWVWHRLLRAWEEEMLGECQTLLFNLSLQDHSSDRWLWQPDLDDGYSVPLKVSIFAWRLMLDRLPTKANLVIRGILPEAEHLCVSRCGAVESAQHLFISCSTFGSLWPLVSSWIGSSLVTAQTLSDHFTQFTTSAGDTRARRSFMQLIWLACVWVVWTERNHKLFRGSAHPPLHMLDKIKRFSFK
ncbi:hypothetical protein TSUD_42980 [Trifolium subterraneum]|uniref:Reverse transcriptase zinc-binding domain-containing protein n=1 Tax=Trifolium subterraneum TaxID=3900 RepID=A0A2Z6LW74_TRISU|nr:hypothetical protein TSUD_42980 [Trifolium subterraneum]